MGTKHPARKQATKKLELIISGGANKLQNYFQWKWQRSGPAMGGPKGKQLQKLPGQPQSIKNWLQLKCHSCLYKQHTEKWKAQNESRKDNDNYAKSGRWGGGENCGGGGWLFRLLNETEKFLCLFYARAKKATRKRRWNFQCSAADKEDKGVGFWGVDAR